MYPLRFKNYIIVPLPMLWSCQHKYNTFTHESHIKLLKLALQTYVKFCCLIFCKGLVQTLNDPVLFCFLKNTQTYIIHISVIHEKIDWLEILYTDYVGLDDWNYQKKLVKMLKVTDILASEKTSHFSLLFFLETLTFSLWLDSNPRPCAPQPNHYTTIPSFLT